MEKFAKTIKVILILSNGCIDGRVIYGFNCHYCGVKISKNEQCHRVFVCGKKECIDKFTKDKEEFEEKYKSDYMEYLLEKLKE